MYRHLKAEINERHGLSSGRGHQQAVRKGEDFWI